jgi:hypothetical protein
MPQRSLVIRMAWGAWAHTEVLDKPTFERLPKHKRDERKLQLPNNIQPLKRLRLGASLPLLGWLSCAAAIAADTAAVIAAGELLVSGYHLLQQGCLVDIQGSQLAWCGALELQYPRQGGVAAPAAPMTIH